MSGGATPVYIVRESGDSEVETAEIAHFRPESSPHRPRTTLQLQHESGGLSGIFRIDDRYVRSVRTRYLDQVFKDSCVEIFLQPKPDGGYFNLEMNAGGAHLCFYIEDHRRTATAFEKYTPLSPDIGQQIEVQSSLPKVIDPEIAEAVAWELKFSIPLAVFEPFIGKLGPLRGQRWRGNFFKCAEEISHPHWASWSPVDEFNFHLPRCFGVLNFA